MYHIAKTARVLPHIRNPSELHCRRGMPLHWFWWFMPQTYEPIFREDGYVSVAQVNVSDRLTLVMAKRPAKLVASVMTTVGPTIKLPSCMYQDDQYGNQQLLVWYWFTTASYKLTQWPTRAAQFQPTHSCATFTVNVDIIPRRTASATDPFITSRYLTIAFLENVKQNDAGEESDLVGLCTVAQHHWSTDTFTWRRW